jgi:hypothetical protein
MAVINTISSEWASSFLHWVLWLCFLGRKINLTTFYSCVHCEDVHFILVGLHASMKTFVPNLF